jgi:hypothetical protein
VVVGIEATGATQWLVEELGIVPGGSSGEDSGSREQKHDRRDGRLLLDLLTREDGFPRSARRSRQRQGAMVNMLSRQII